MISNSSRKTQVFLFLIVLLLAGWKPAGVTPIAAGADERPITIASKKFTESVILGEIAAQLIQNSTAMPSKHRAELGGTRVLFNALERGEIDIYPEYTGTILREILGEYNLTDARDMLPILEERGIMATKPLGFNNTYAIGMRPETAQKLGIVTISDLRNHPELKIGFTNEFLDRGDGWPSLQKHYQLPHEDVRGLDHDLAYRAISSDDIDVMDFYSTDAEIAYYGLYVLEDDLDHFPLYKALYLYRADLETSAPRAVEALRRLEGKLDEERIQNLNKRVKIDRESESRIAAGYLAESFNHTSIIQESGLWGRLWVRTVEHLILVSIALIMGVVVAIPLGVLAFKSPRTASFILGLVGIIQTIPALALLVFMIPLLGIYAPPAIAALFLYSLLPMVRNTHAGLQGIPLPIEESAEALGLSATGRLFYIELPLASPSILAGIKTSAVITIGFATLGALIGAGGYGQPILTGIRLDNYGLILEGAVPAAALALIVQWLFDGAERLIVPRGLRIRRTS